MRRTAGRATGHLAAPFATLLLAAAILLALAAPAPARFYAGADWDHIEKTLKAFGRRPPAVPVVYLLGGSAARECITTEPGWSAQIADLGGGKVRALDFGSSSQSFKNDLKIVRAAPAVPSIVLIGLNVGRYTSIPPKTLAPPARSTRGGAYDPHRFHAGDQLGDAAKLAIVRQWLALKYPRFRRRFAGNDATLRELIQLCQDKGFCPVLVELPLNLRVVGRSWDAARDRYRRGARAAAREHGIPYEDFVARIGLTSPDFVDLAHLVEPGRAKYQRALSRLVVARIKQYGLKAE
jgi:hypothetical protein